MGFGLKSAAALSAALLWFAGCGSSVSNDEGAAGSGAGSAGIGAGGRGPGGAANTSGGPAEGGLSSASAGSNSAGLPSHAGAGGHTGGAIGAGGVSLGGASQSAGSAGSGVAGGASGGVSHGGSAGAGSTGHAGSGGSGGGAVVAMLTPTINAFCATARACCSKQNLPSTLTNCESQFAMNNETVASLASGAATLNSAALSTCLAAYTQAAATCEENPVLSACQGVVIGTRAENAPCAKGAECQRIPGPSTCLITDSGSKVGLCKSVPHAKSGESCLFTCRAGEDCTSTTYGVPNSSIALCFGEEGLYCDQLGGAATCKPLHALGATCDNDEQCGVNNYCDTTCKKRGQLGDPCTRCLDSLTCVNNHCVSPPFGSFNTCEGRSLGPY